MRSAILAQALASAALFRFQPPRGHRCMLVNSPIFNEISGKLGGAVGMTSKFGMQLRGNVTPNNPDTGPQFIVRGILSQLSAIWRATFNDATRASWEELAEATPGNLSGLNAFVKANTERLRAGLPYGNTPPESLTTELTIPTSITIDDSANTIAIDVTANADAGDPWTQDGGGLNVYVEREQPSSRNTRIHPFTFIGTILGDTAPPTGSHSFSLATFFPTVAGKIMYVKLVAFTDDNQVSRPYQVRQLIQA